MFRVNYIEEKRKLYVEEMRERELEKKKKGKVNRSNSHGALWKIIYSIQFKKNFFLEKYHSIREWGVKNKTKKKFFFLLANTKG